MSVTVIAIMGGKIGETKRYWPGKAPDWAVDTDEDGDVRLARAVRLEIAFPSHDEWGIVRKDGPRFRRLAEIRVDNRDEIRADHRRIRQAEIVLTEEEENRRNEGVEVEEEDDDALNGRRRRIEEKIFLRQQEETPLLGEEELEYETDSEEEHMEIPMTKMVYVAKSERGTIAERNRLAAEDRAIGEAEKRRRLEHRKIETRPIVVDKNREDTEIQKNMELQDVADMATDDEVNEAEKYEAWQARKIARIERDKRAKRSNDKKRRLG